MRVIFMGTPDFAVPTLQALIDNKHEVVAVYSQPDKPKGRGHKMAFPPVKELAIKYDIPVYQPQTLKSDEVAQEISKLSPQVIVVVAYGKILPESILTIPSHGCINVHGSLLPKYRGAAPIQWSVLNGDEITGVTTMYMEKGLDTGDMLLKAETKIGENETASMLHDRLSIIGADLLIKTLDELDTITPQKQNDEDSTYASMLNKDMSAIDFNKTATQVHNKIRGLSSWPCAHTTLLGKRLKVYQSEVVSGYKGNAGEILCNKTFIVACGENTAVRLVKVQYDNSKQMPSEDFLRGKQINNGQVLGE